MPQDEGPSAGMGGHTDRAPPLEEGQAEAIFAGGCFWCMEKPFETEPGVLRVTSGYTGGEVRGPSYDEVSSSSTQHAEAVRVVYDPETVSYDRLLEIFWHNIDPTQANGQFCDHGPQYRSGIFAVDAEQRRRAEASLKKMKKRFDETVHTEIADAGPFWVAEAYHQDFYRTHSRHYQRYRQGCGRDERLRSIWGDEAGH
jgi:peptide-methionine (S)-S-oxide reductase